MSGIFRFLAVVTISLLALNAHSASAENVAANLVAPARADAIASPLTFRTIQTSTETENSALFLTPNATQFRTRVGIDTYIGSRNKLYDLPLSLAFSPDLQAQLNIPVVSAETGSSSTETGMGDIRLSIKFRADMDKLFESYYIFTAKFPSGDPESGLGTGSYDFSFTHKTIVMLGNYRTTFMAGVTIPPPTSITVLGSNVEYAPTISYMAATERTLSSTDLRFCIKAAGMHAFNSRINSELQKNAVTTLDIIPEVAYRFSGSASLNAGIIVPLVTLYELPGASNRRDPIINLSVYKSF